jgi:hypothetical protein
MTLIERKKRLQMEAMANFGETGEGLP